MKNISRVSRAIIETKSITPTLLDNENVQVNMFMTALHM